MPVVNALKPQQIHVLLNNPQDLYLDSGVFGILWRGNAEGVRLEAPWRVVRGCPPPTGGGSGQDSMPLPGSFLNFWFKMGHFLYKFLCSGKGGHLPTLNTPLDPDYLRPRFSGSVDFGTLEHRWETVQHECCCCARFMPTRQKCL